MLIVAHPKLKQLKYFSLPLLIKDYCYGLNLFSLGHPSSTSVAERTSKEFPKRCIKRTKTEPEIQWSYNPCHDASAYIMSRKDILDEASNEEMKYLEGIMLGKGMSKDDEKHNQNGKID